MLQEFLLLSYDTLFEFNLKKIRKKREFAFVQSKVIRMFLVFVLFKILFETITNDLSLIFFSAHAPLNCLHWIHDQIREWLGRLAEEARERVLVWYDH